MKYADNVKTPTLFIHSEEDYRCWLAEGLQMFTSLKYNGVESKLVMFRGENHELSRSGKPKHRVRRLKEITAWFDNYLK
jgi:dipeptidyl aminopeptidase/acylaminoacyl peptidase